MTAPRPTTPSQTIGPFFHLLVEPGRERVAPPDHPDAMRLEGRVTDGAGEPVADALLEIWHADPAGRYAHPDDPRARECDPRFTGYARAATDPNGQYRFVTVRPGPVPAPGGGAHAPHVAMSVFARGLLDRLITRVYLAPDDTDPVLASVPDERRATLIAVDEGDRFVFDIHLQGDRETVFFEV
ncbi:MAG: protocatechuate 3,4-dioxygenase subunit alpha [Acidimicrobiales bacterium]